MWFVVIGLCIRGWFLQGNEAVTEFNKCIYVSLGGWNMSRSVSMIWLVGGKLRVCLLLCSTMGHVDVHVVNPSFGKDHEIVFVLGRYTSCYNTMFLFIGQQVLMTWILLTRLIIIMEVVPIKHGWSCVCGVDALLRISYENIMTSKCSICVYMYIGLHHTSRKRWPCALSV